MWFKCGVRFKLKISHIIIWKDGAGTTHLDDQVSLGVTGHSAELGGQLLELRPAVCVNHPAWGRRTEEDGDAG